MFTKKKSLPERVVDVIGDAVADHAIDVAKIGAMAAAAVGVAAVGASTAIEIARGGRS